MSIQTELTRITNAKTAIKTAIEGKGVTVPDGTLLDGMAALIEAISSESNGAIIEEGTFTPEKDLTNAKIYSERFKQTLKLPMYMLVRPILNTASIKDMEEAFLFVVEYFPVEIPSSGLTKITFNVYACGYSKTYSQEAADYAQYYKYLSETDKKNGLLYLFNNIELVFKASTTYRWTAIW